MAHLSYPSGTDVQLRLGAQEDAILAVVRGCPWWTKADIEGQFPGSTTVSSVTLTTTRNVEATLRRILQMSFGLVFPQEGGVGQQLAREAPRVLGAKRRSSR